MRRKLLLGSMLAMSWLTLTACASGRYYTRYPAPPPRPVYGVVGVAPGPGYVWCDGFYDLRDSRWIWSPGYWARSPRPRAVWAPGSWQYSPRYGYRFHKGRWR